MASDQQAHSCIVDPGLKQALSDLIDDVFAWAWHRPAATQKDWAKWDSKIALILEGHSYETVGLILTEQVTFCEYCGTGPTCGVCGRGQVITQPDETDIAVAVESVKAKDLEWEQRGEEWLSNDGLYRLCQHSQAPFFVPYYRGRRIVGEDDPLLDLEAAKRWCQVNSELPF